VFWGSLFAALLLWGPGGASLDVWVISRLRSWTLRGRPQAPGIDIRGVSRAA